MERIMQEEVIDLIEELKSKVNEPITTSLVFNATGEFRKNLE
jgi:hypothetical protein